VGIFFALNFTLGMTLINTYQKHLTYNLSYLKIAAYQLRTGAANERIQPHQQAL